MKSKIVGSVVLSTLLFGCSPQPSAVDEDQISSMEEKQEFEDVSDTIETLVKIFNLMPEIVKDRILNGSEEAPDSEYNRIKSIIDDTKQKNISPEQRKELDRLEDVNFYLFMLDTTLSLYIIDRSFKTSLQEAVVEYDEAIINFNRETKGEKITNLKGEIPQ